MSYKGIRFTLHLFGRVMVSLSIEWIRSNSVEGPELTTHPSTGIFSCFGFCVCKPIVTGAF